MTMMRAQVMFEEWLTPILDAMVVEQREQGVVWTPSKMIHRMGKEIDNPDSVYYWCYKNNIPVYSPAITDGSIGDMIFFHSFKNSLNAAINVVSHLRAATPKSSTVRFSFNKKTL